MGIFSFQDAFPNTPTSLITYTCATALIYNDEFDYYDLS